MPQFDYYINSPDSSAKWPLDREILNILNSEDINGFHNSFRTYAPTPLLGLPNLASVLGVKSIMVKDESKRFGVQAIKSLGALYAMSKILDTRTGRQTFCTATDGNHGWAVAYAARYFDQKAVVFVPENTVRSRIENIENENADVHVVRGDYDQAVEEARLYARQKPAILIQDTSWEGYEMVPAMITVGYLTQMLEIEDQINDEERPFFDIIILQGGVGTWPSSVVHYFKSTYKENSPKIIIAEPYESDCLLESAKRKKRSTTKKSQHTIMAGLNCGTPSKIAWEILQKGVDAFISIPDEYAIRAMKQFYNPMKDDPQIESGEAGAAGLGALMALMLEKELENLKKKIGINKDSNLLIFNTEGITDPVFFQENITTPIP